MRNKVQNQCRVLRKPLPREGGAWVAKVLTPSGGSAQVGPGSEPSHPSLVVFACTVGQQWYLPPRVAEGIRMR